MAAAALPLSLPADTAPPAPPLPQASLPLAPGTAEVVRDVLPLAQKARTQDASLFTVRRPVPASGVLKDAVFLHPQRIGRPARAEFALALPRIASGERLLLAFDIGLSDGIPEAGHARLDGVRFAVEAEGKRLFESDWRESRWQSGAVDLTALAGRTTRLAFLADPKANLEYDWALFGEPRLIRIAAAPKTTSIAAAVASQTCDIVTGVAVASHSSGRAVRLRLVPEGGGDDTPVEWRSVPVPGSDRRVITALDFSFPRARSVRIAVEGEDTTRRSVYIARYRAHPVLTHVTATVGAPRAGSVVPLRIEMRNRGRGLLAKKQAHVTLFLNGRRIGQKSVDAALAPGERWRTEFAWRAPKKPGVVTLKARIDGSGNHSLSGSVETFAPPERANTVFVENGSLRVEFVRSSGGYAYGRVLTRSGGGWRSVGTLRPLLRGRVATPTGEREWEVRPRLAHVSGREIVFTETAVPDPQGVPWKMRLSVTLDPERPLARLHYSWTPARERAIAALWGPNLYVSDNAPAGDAKLWGLFPGLEYLYLGEPSSSTRGFAPPLHDRSTPHPWKVTVPLMAVSVSADGSPAAPPLNPPAFWSPDSLKNGAGNHSSSDSPARTVALWWDPLQKWDANNSRAYPSARFSSPNDEQGMDNHRLGLFVPSVPDQVNENDERARSPYRIRAGQTLTLEATLWGGEGPALAALGAWVRDRGGLPAPPAPPRSHEAVFDLSRTAYEKTVWNPKTRRWRSTIEGGDETVAAAAALLLLDSRTAAELADRKRSADLAEAGTQAMLEQNGPGALVSREGSHILRWELPFLYGYLPEAFAALEQEIEGILAAQQPDGGWRFGPRDPIKATLGTHGDSVSGVNSHHAWMLLRYARVTGDIVAREAGLKALRFIERFRIPRGASIWECPIYEPDILASAWLLSACLEGWQATGETRWLHDAVYWAESATPFIYLWTVPERPAMLGASIPIFGTTFYTHSWLATPVQWEGLTLAFHLRRLAEELERAGARPDAGGSPLPVVLDFASQDWKRLAELLTVSGLHQQIASGERIGTYPDSITDFVRPNPVYLHPENLLANLFSEKGVVPDIQTARRGGIIISAVGAIKFLEASESSVRFRYTAAGNSHISSGSGSDGVLIRAPHPRRVLVDGQPLARSAAPLKREPGWFWDESRRRLYLNVPQKTDTPSIIDIAR